MIDTEEIELELEETQPEPEPTTAEGMTELEKKQRQQYRDNIASGKSQFRIPTKLARILGYGNTDGYNDFLAGLPPSPKSDDFIYVRGYEGGYRMASKGKVPQREQLRRLGLLEKIESCRDLAGN